MTTTMKSHRDLYPDQYRHPLVGQAVTYWWEGQQRVGTLERVVQSRFGPLAIIDTLPPRTAVALGGVERTG